MEDIKDKKAFLMKQIKYKTTFITAFIIKLLGYLTLFCFFAGVWYEPMRWRLIITSISTFALALLFTFVEQDRKKKFEEGNLK